MKWFFIYIIIFYQKYISPDRGLLSIFFKPSCIFYPSCSEYSRQAFEKYGVLKGFKLSINRIYRCNPLNTPKIDNLS